MGSAKKGFFSEALHDHIFDGILIFFAAFVLCIIAALLITLITGSWESLRAFGFKFLISDDWDPVKESYGALPFIFGTLVSSILSLILAIFVGLGVAIFLTQVCPVHIKRPLWFVVELLAIVPSVIYGLWGIYVLAPWVRNTLEPFLANTLGFLPFFQGSQIGVGMLSGGIILAIMIVPFIISVSSEVMSAVPRTYKEASLALGATRWEMIKTAIIPYAKSGLIGAIFLALGRALGETMAVTMVIGNGRDMSASLFAPSATIASLIANEFSEATSSRYTSALIEMALVLFAMTIVVNIIARWLIWKVASPIKGRMAE